jgi:protein-serine/threonine kinase
MPDAQRRPGPLQDLINATNPPHTRPNIDTNTIPPIATHQQPATKTANDDFHVLLTPPPQNDQLNPLDKMALTTSPVNLRDHPEQDQVQEHDPLRPTRSRRDETMSSITSNPTQDPTTMLNGLSIKTDLGQIRRSGSQQSIGSEYRLRSSASAASLPRRAPSIRAALHSTAGSLSPGSVISSPQIAAMLDITPLPSPTISAFESWKHVTRTRSRTSSTSSRSDLPSSLFPPLSSSPGSPRRKVYPGLNPSTGRKSLDETESADRNRSVSEYVPEGLAVPKPRNIAVSGPGPAAEASSSIALHREHYLGETRGIVPTPTTSVFSSDATYDQEPAPKRQKREIFKASSVFHGQPRMYEGLRELGKGTFSTVYLAVRKVHDRKDTLDYAQDSINMAGVKARSQRLVAIKVVEHGPAGGADAERIETSLKREVELLKAVQHPSLVHLKAFGTDGGARALLVMNYCPGGDLFDLASTKLDVLTPPLVRRIFAELVSAVRYLHQKYIVHRDIKLESRSNFSLFISLCAIEMLIKTRCSAQHTHPGTPRRQRLANDRSSGNYTD